jgi:uncharacterized protein YpmS
MAEPQPIKKGMGKSLVIALGVLVVILATSLIYTYTSLQGQISSLNTDKTNLQTQVTSLTTDKNNLNSQVTSLQSQLNNLISIINLTNSTVWVDNQTVTHYTGLYTAFGFLSSYAGYISVDVESSTSSHTYVRVIYLRTESTMTNKQV